MVLDTLGLRGRLRVRTKPLAVAGARVSRDLLELHLSLVVFGAACPSIADLDGRFVSQLFLVAVPPGPPVDELPALVGLVESVRGAAALVLVDGLGRCLELVQRPLARGGGGVRRGKRFRGRDNLH